MANEEVKVESSFPSFESIESLHTRSISTPNDSVSVDLDAEEVRVDTSSDVSVSGDSPVQPIRRGRGRPKGSKNRSKIEGIPTPSDVDTRLSGRLAKDVSLRLQQTLKGVTKIPALWVEPIQMQDQEAQDIADPLASYVTRRAEESTALGEFLRGSLENFDLIAAGIGISSYIIRVAKDIQDYNEYKRAEYAERRTTQPSRETVERGRDMVQQSRREQTVTSPRQTQMDGSQPSNQRPETSEQAVTWDFVSTPAIGQL